MLLNRTYNRQEKTRAKQLCEPLRVVSPAGRQQSWTDLLISSAISYEFKTPSSLSNHKQVVSWSFSFLTRVCPAETRVQEALGSRVVAVGMNKCRFKRFCAKDLQIEVPSLVSHTKAPLIFTRVSQPPVQNLIRTIP